jgi:Fic family protein
MTTKTTDDPRVTKVLTFKSGKVAFSRNHDWSKAFGTLGIIDGAYAALSSLPILPSFAGKLETDLIRRAIFGTAAIEGNPLSEERVGEILEEPTLDGLRDRAEQEIVNLKEAYRLHSSTLPDKHDQHLLISEDFIRAINERVTRGVGGDLHTPGMYRDHAVYVGNAEHGGTYTPPKIRADIETLMAAFVDWMNSDDMRTELVPVRAALAHYHLALIHPFGDGNGRTARLLEVAILAHAAYEYIPTMLSNYYYRNVDAYYLAFRQCETSKSYGMTPFITFVLEGLQQSMLELHDIISGHIRLLALGGHYRKLREDKDITQRQHDLLLILLQSPQRPLEPSALRTDPHLAPLYRKTSDSTPRRDLKRLLELQLLLPAEGGGYRLNEFTLG